MGPIALYDKSFLEGLNVDEAVLFDHFFYPVTSPIFFVETMADLDKEVRAGRTPEQVVGSLAYRAPEMHGAPCIHHRTLALADLQGAVVPMTGQIPIAGGRPVRVDGKSGVIISYSPEALAFQRWQRGQFLDLERDFAKGWREDLRRLDLEQRAATAKNYGVDLQGCRTLADVLARADQVLAALSPAQQVDFALERLPAPSKDRATILARWYNQGMPALRDFAEYAHHVLRVELFFEVGLAAGRISTQRSSNANDIAYLFYLPFCMAFFSSDRLHREAAPLFMRVDQSFVWGPDAKSALRDNHQAMQSLPEELRNRGLISLGTDPKPGLIRDLYDRHLRRATPGPAQPVDPSKIPSAPEMIEKIRQARTLRPEEVDFSPNDAQSITVERQMRKKRGSWFQVPHDLEPEGD